MAGFPAPRALSRYALAGFFLLAGANHFLDPTLYLKIMSPYVPWPYAMVLLSGAAEAGLGAAALATCLRRLAGWGLLAPLIAIFPANTHMALHPEAYPMIGRAILYARLPLQGS